MREYAVANPQKQPWDTSFVIFLTICPQGCIVQDTAADCKPFLQVFRRFLRFFRLGFLLRQRSGVMLRFHGEILFRQTPVHQERHQAVQAGAYRHAEVSVKCSHKTVGVITKCQGVILFTDIVKCVDWKIFTKDTFQTYKYNIRILNISYYHY